MNYIKVKQNENIVKYLQQYNKNMLDNYITFINKNNPNKYLTQDKSTLLLSLPPKEPNFYLKLFSITHIFSFLAGYYLSNLFK
jgi:hypothetical protein